MSHPGEENAVCLEGSVVVTIDHQEFVLTDGDSISFDSGRPHQVENRGNRKGGARLRDHAACVLKSGWLTPPDCPALPLRMPRLT